MLSFTYKPFMPVDIYKTFMLSVILLNVVSPWKQLESEAVLVKLCI
jgi:hypothetical protein